MAETETKTRRKVTFKDVHEFQKHVIRTWKPVSESWPFLYGNEILTLLSGVSAMHIVHFFRKELKLRPMVRVTSYVPVMGLSMLFGDLWHGQVLNSRIIEGHPCTLCTNVSAALGQASASVAYPLIMSPVVTFYLAERLLTYPLPTLQKAPIAVLNIWSNLIMKNRRSFLISGVINMMVAYFVTSEKQNFMWRYWNEN